MGLGDFGGLGGLDNNFVEFLEVRGGKRLKAKAIDRVVPATPVLRRYTPTSKKTVSASGRRAYPGGRSPSFVVGSNARTEVQAYLRSNRSYNGNYNDNRNSKAGWEMALVPPPSGIGRPQDGHRDEFEKCGRLLPQTIPHPVAKCAKGWGTRVWWWARMPGLKSQQLRRYQAL